MIKLRQKSLFFFYKPCMYACNGNNKLIRSFSWNLSMWFCQYLLSSCFCFKYNRVIIDGGLLNQSSWLKKWNSFLMKFINNNKFMALCYIWMSYIQAKDYNKKNNKLTFVISCICMYSIEFLTWMPTPTPYSPDIA